jgi:hypothetical protein
MTTDSSTGYGFNELAGMLLAAAGGLHTSEAAAELVIAHQAWLLRANFTTNFITVTHDDDVDGYADINWPAAIDALDNGLLPCSGSEANMLRIAASLAGQAPITIGTAVSGLDTRNITLVLKAIARASGYRNAGVSLG